MTVPKHYSCTDVEQAIENNTHLVKVNETPLIAYRDDMISVQDCADFIALAKDRMTRSVVVGGKVSPGRTSTVAWIPHAITPRFHEIAKGIASMVGLPLSHAENFQVIHYQQGAQYRAHYDAFDLQTHRGVRTLQRGGQRIATTLCYLNTVEEGGATRFPKLDLDIVPRPGRLVLFNNCAAHTMERDDLSLHAGSPVKAGEKWAFNLWFRQYPVSYNPYAEVQDAQMQ